MGRTSPGLTRERVFRFVRQCLLAGRPPTVREVQERFGFRAVQTARAHLERLVKEGRLMKEEGKARGYRLAHRGGDPPVVTALVPVLGGVPAGPLDVALEEIEGYVPIERRGHGGAGAGGYGSDEEELFGLRVRGESMTGAGILPGDLVIVRRQPTARSGDIVVALVGDEATVKIFRPRSRRKGHTADADTVELHPANPAFSPITPDPSELTILGKVVEVRRYLR